VITQIHFFAIIVVKKGFRMQKIIIEVKDNYTTNVLEMLHGLQGVMIEKIKLDTKERGKVDLDFIKLQTESMKKTWDNQEDEAWDDL
jgi:predicted RNA-binding protein with RPS1 domain